MLRRRSCQRLRFDDRLRDEPRFDDDLRDELRFEEDLRDEDDLRVDDRLRGTFAPFSRASDSPIAIACFRLVTLRPLPLLSVPFLRRRIALSTRLPAALPYRRLLELFFLAAICRTLLKEWDRVSARPMRVRSSVPAQRLFQPAWIVASVGGQTGSGARRSSTTARGARRRTSASDASSVAMQNPAQARPMMIPAITSDG